MPYTIRGTILDLPPTAGGWVEREPYGLDGNGHPIYPPTREFRLEWGIESQAQWFEVQQLFETLHVTGSAVVQLPQWDGSTYVFREYSGCVVQEPQFERYFTEHPTSVVLLISNIRT